MVEMFYISKVGRSCWALLDNKVGPRCTFFAYTVMGAHCMKITVLPSDPPPVPPLKYFLRLNRLKVVYNIVLF